LHRFDTDHECDGRTDGQTDGQTPRRWLRRAKHSALARNKKVQTRITKMICMTPASATWCIKL